MAIFVCQFQNITRSEGRSAVAAAAYRSGEKIKNQWDGVEHDFTHKSGIVYQNILLPDHAPPEYQDRATLWNAVELAEKASDSRLCMECIVALPVELSPEQQIELVEAYVQENFVSKGMCADIAIHNPVLTDDLHRPIDKDGNPTTDPAEYQYINPHAHILLTVRPIDKKGKWEAKTQKEYLCKRGKEQKGFTAQEFKATQAEGWEKQYQYRVGNGKIWLTPSEAAAGGLENQDRVSRSPRSTPHGRENPTAAYWNDPRRVTEWRKAWEEIVNQKFKLLGMEERIDARSYADQGKHQQPGVHMGHSAHNAEKRAKRLNREGTAQRNVRHTDKGKDNEAVARYNQSVKQYQRLQKQTDAKITSTAARLERLRSDLIHAGYQGSAIRKGILAAQKMAEQKEADVTDMVALLDTVNDLNRKAVAVMEALTRLLESTSPLQWERRREISRQIEQKKREVTVRTAYMQTSMRQRGYSDEQALKAATQSLTQEKAHIVDMGSQADRIREAEARLAAEYTAVLDSVLDTYLTEVDSRREVLRVQEEAALRAMLQKELGEVFSPEEYQYYAQAVGKGTRLGKEAQKAKSQNRSR